MENNYLDKFSGVAKIYDIYRPGYPEKFIKEYISKANVINGDTIADIGAGTGKITDILSNRGFKLKSIEINEDMLNTLKYNTKYKNDVEVINGKAESTNLNPLSVDSIIVGQAFHWFDAEEFKKECKRILKSDESKVCLIWNSRDTENDIAQECMKIFRKYCPHFGGFRGGVESGEKYADTFFKEYERCVIENDTEFDLLGFLGRNLSMSYAPKYFEEGYVDFIKELTALYEKFNEHGMITVKNNIVYYIGTV